MPSRSECIYARSEAQMLTNTVVGCICSSLTLGDLKFHSIFISLQAVESGATGPLIQLMMHADLNLAEQATWAVANIAGDSAQLRDFVIREFLVMWGNGICPGCFDELLRIVCFWDGCGRSVN